MFRHLPRLLFWQMRFDGRRLSVWLAGGIYIALAGLGLIKIVALLPWSPAAPSPGKYYFNGLNVLHSVLAPLCAAIIGARAVDDRTAGVLALVKISDLPSRDWAAFRILSLVASFLPIWAMRLPFYALAFHMGGLRLESILIAELLQWTSFLFVGSLMLMIARVYDTSQAARLGVLGLCLLFELMLVLPLRLLYGIELALGSQPVPGFDVLERLGQVMSRLSLLSQMWASPVVVGDWRLAAGSIALHLIVAGLALFVFARRVFVGVGIDDSVGSTAAEKEKSFVRPSRRVWDDALAWQAFHIHSQGPQVIRLKVAAYVFCGIAFVVLLASPNWFLPTFVAVSLIASLAIAAYKSGDCLTRELKAGTLSTLALLPYDGREIFHGWERGARRLALPDWGWAGICITALATGLGGYIDRASFPIWVALAAALLLSAPFFYVNSLAAFEWAYLPVGCFTVIAVNVVPFLSVMIGITVSPWVGLVVFLFLVVAMRWVLLKMIPGCFVNRLEKLP
jgi:hypothetical protein